MARRNQRRAASTTGRQFAAQTIKEELFGTVDRNTEAVLQGIKDSNSKLHSDSLAGFNYRGELYTNGAAPWVLIELDPSLHERMDDWLVFRTETREQSNKVMTQLSNLMIQGKSRAEVLYLIPDRLSELFVKGAGESVYEGRLTALNTAKAEYAFLAEDVDELLLSNLLM